METPLTECHMSESKIVCDKPQLQDALEQSGPSSSSSRASAAVQQLQVAGANRHSAAGRLPSAVSAGCDLLLQEALEQARHLSRVSRSSFAVQLPWETGFAGFVLGNSEFPVLGLPPVIGLTPRLPMVLGNQPEVDEDERRRVQVFKRVRFSRIPDESWPVQADRLREVALRRWKLVIEVDLMASVVGRQITSFCSASLGHRVEELLRDTFEGKATGTLDMRSSSLLHFIRWCGSSVTVGAQALPFKEEDVYNFLCELRDAGAAPTKASRFMEAVTFSHYVIGADGALAVSKSRRCQGASLCQYLMKRALMQKDALTVRMVMELEVCIAECESCYDQVAAGHFCFMILGRLRFSDSQRVTSIDADYGDLEFGLVEAQTFRTKTATSKEKKTIFLPVVAPMQGLTGL